MKTMLPRERILNALAGKETDRVPYNEIFFGHRAYAEHFGGPQHTFEDACRYIANSGQCSIMAGGFWYYYQSKSAKTAHGESRYSGGDMLTMDDVIAMPVPDFEATAETLKKNIAAARKYDLSVHFFLMNAFHSASTSMGLDNFCLALYDNPEMVNAYLDKIEDFNRSVIRKLRPYGVDFVFFDGDCAYKNGLMVSPSMFRDLWFDRTKKTVSICREQNLPYCYHTDGKGDDVYPLLIELGFSATHGVEAAANDLSDIKSRFGKDLTLIGNFDIADLAQRTPEEIRAMTRQMLSSGAAGGRYVAACNTLPGDNIPLENFLAFHDEIVNFKLQ